MLKATAAILVFAFGLTACGSSLGEPRADEEVASTESAATACSIAESDTVYKIGAGDVKLKPVSTHFCWLSKMSGNFDGSNGAIPGGAFVFPQNDGNWHLQSPNDIAATAAEARCVALSCFTADGVNDQVMTTATTNLSAIASCTSNVCDRRTQTAWGGNAATVLNTFLISTNTTGANEYADVATATDPISPSIITAQDCTNDGVNFLQAGATSLFVGTPGQVSMAQFTGEFSISGTATADLGVFASSAFCYFTHIGGKFRGSGEYVRLVQKPLGPNNSKLWYAESHQGSSGREINASGRCFFYNQWTL
jgi:hypothetical protein